MKFSLSLLILPLMAIALAGCATATAYLVYPKTRTVDHVDDYHGVKVADPYRWLEDDNSAETKAWVEAQNRVTYSYLHSIPEVDRVKTHITKLWNYERFGLPSKHGARYFISRNDGLQNQSVLFSMNNLEDTPAVLLDPNTLSTDGTVALTSTHITDDGNLMAYGLASGGSDWQEWHVRDIRTLKDLPDHIKWVKFSSASWNHDGTGFYYSRYDEPIAADALKGANFFHKLYFHKLGTAQTDDRLVYHSPEHKDWLIGGGVTDDGKYLIIQINRGSAEDNRVSFQDLSQPNAPVVDLISEFDAKYDFIDNDGSVFWFRTNLKAPRGRIIAIDTTNPNPAHWKEIIPQSGETMTGANVVNNQFIIHYLKDAHSQVKVFNLQGKPVREVALPGIGSASGFGGKRTDTESFYSFASFNMAATIYRLDLKTGNSTVFRQPKVAFDPNAYEVNQIFYKSKDGTRIPMFITHKKGLKLNGKNPTYLYAYGGFNISMTPSFSAGTIAWLEMGGIYAVPNLRGGGEYGEEWHKAGTKAQKQNVFDDFIAAAEWLIANKYTSKSHLVIAGGSNGGLLVGACMTQRPDLYGACLPAVGVMDMLRFHKFTIGWAWVTDYGSSDDPNEFKSLRAYSPYHNIRPGTKYPPTLITTADHDDRVVPAHSFKFAAAMQAAQAGEAPILIRIDTRAGHGAGKPTTKVIDELSERYAFLIRELGMQLPKNY